MARSCRVRPSWDERSNASKKCKPSPLAYPTLDRLPTSRITALPRFANAAKAQAVARLPDDRRIATLLAFVRTLEASAHDDVLDLFDVVVTRMFSDAKVIGQKDRLGSIRDLDAAAQKLKQAFPDRRLTASNTAGARLLRQVAPVGISPGAAPARNFFA
jgi:hypothetical protein